MIHSLQAQTPQSSSNGLHGRTMFLFLVGVLVSVLVVGIGLLIRQARHMYGTLERLNIPVVKPYFVFGSDPFYYNTVVQVQDMKYMKEYGKIYGFYQGSEPMIFISDPEIIKLVMVKDYSHFSDKRSINFGHPLINEMMDNLPGEKWKVVRSTISPSLTTGKLRHMSNTMNQAVVDMMKILDEKCRPEYNTDICHVFTCLSIDFIARCAFGTHLHSILDNSNAFMKHAKALSGEDPTFLDTLGRTFEFVSDLAPPFMPVKSTAFFESVIRRMLKERREAGITYNDFVDVLLEMEGNLGSEEYKRLGIKEMTVLSQAFVFLIAAFETTSNTICSMLYYLAINQDKMAVLLAEVDQFLADNQNIIDHDTVNNPKELVYMNACINEALRLCPTVIRAERVCTRDWECKERGLRIPKGQVILTPIFALHRNPEYWPNPDAFVPERMLPENKESIVPYSYVPFGVGPHSCVGNRYSIEAIRLTMTAFLRDFTIKPNMGTHLIYRPGRVFLFEYEPYKATIVRRHK